MRIAEGTPFTVRLELDAPASSARPALAPGSVSAALGIGSLEVIAVSRAEPEVASEAYYYSLESSIRIDDVTPILEDLVQHVQTSITGAQNVMAVVEVIGTSPAAVAAGKREGLAWAGLVLGGVLGYALWKALKSDGNRSSPSERPSGYQRPSWQT